MFLIWLKSEKNIFVVLMINVPQFNVNYVTNLTISQITNHACKALIKHLYVKTINMCMDKRNEFGETPVLWITLPYMYYLYKKRYKYNNWSQCKNYNLTIYRTIQELYKKLFA